MTNVYDKFGTTGSSSLLENSSVTGWGGLINTRKWHSGKIVLTCEYGISLSG